MLCVALPGVRWLAFIQALAGDEQDPKMRVTMLGEATRQQHLVEAAVGTPSVLNELGHLMLVEAAGGGD